MRRYVLLIFALLLTTSCSRPDFDSSTQVRAWLESLDRGAKVIQVWCKGNREEPPGSGVWKEFDLNVELDVAEVLDGLKGRSFDWEDTVALTITTVKNGLPGWMAMKEGVPLSQTEKYEMGFKAEDVHCDGKPLRSPPPIRVGKCPNDIDGCEDVPPMATDLPPLLPPPDPGGGGDF